MYNVEEEKPLSVNNIVEGGAERHVFMVKTEAGMSGACSNIFCPRLWFIHCTAIGRGIERHVFIVKDRSWPFLGLFKYILSKIVVS